MRARRIRQLPAPVAAAYLAVVGVLVAGLLAAVVTAPVASAHATRLSTEPAADASLTAGPSQVSATFNERLQTTFAAMTVVGPDGNLWSSGDTAIQEAVVSTGVRPLGPAGTYAVNYRVTSADGHVVTGSWSFRLTVAGAGTPGPSAAPAGDRDAGSDMPVWPFAAGVIAAVGAAALWAMRRRP